MKISTSIKVITLVLAFPFLLAFGPVQEENPEIFQTDTKIVIDGQLDEWSGISSIPVSLTPDGEKREPSADLTVSAQFTYDAENFYAAVVVLDDVLEFPKKAQVHRDGLYIAFIDPEPVPKSDRFSVFAFSIIGDREIIMLVNRDGRYSPPIRVDDIQAKVKPQEEESTVVYEIGIPWSYLSPLKPFFHQTWGINVVYDDRDRGDTEFVHLHPDSSYEKEGVEKRSGTLFWFVNHTPSEPEFQCSINGSFFADGAEKKIICAINSPADLTGWKIRRELSTPLENVSNVEDISFQKGMKLLEFPIQTEQNSSGMYVLSVGIIDDKGSLQFREDFRYFVLNKEEFDSFGTKLEKAKTGDLQSEDERFRESLPTLEIRLDWIRGFLEDSHPFAAVYPLQEWYEEVVLLIKNIEKSKPALPQPGLVGRLAHKSAIDGTLQPYSVYVPETYTEKDALPLIVTLHPHGVDDQRTIQEVGRAVSFMSYRLRLKKGFIVLAPKARDLGGWYLGDSAKDVLECIAHIQKLYSIDERNIIIEGHSMGGYGAWRLSLLNPGMFKATVVRSSVLIPPPDKGGEHIMDLLDRPRNEKFMVVHGSNDTIVPVASARTIVERLKALGIVHDYIEVKDAGHGRYDKWRSIMRWVIKIMETYPD